MSRRLTEKQLEEKQVLRIVNRIKTIEEHYGIDLTKRACQRYAVQRASEKKLEKEIADRELELRELKKKAR